MAGIQARARSTASSPISATQLEPDEGVRQPRDGSHRHSRTSRVHTTAVTGSTMALQSPSVRAGHMVAYWRTLEIF